MSEPVYLKCNCKECGNPIEFPAAIARTTIPCPHCGQWTELVVPGEPPPGEKCSDRGSVVILLGALLLGALAAGGFYYIHPRSNDPTAVKPAPITNDPPKLAVIPSNPPPAPPVVEHRPKSPEDLKVGDVKLEKTPGNSLVYAVGTLKNDSEYQRFGVKIDLELLDTNGLVIGVTRDQKAIIEPRQKWRFHALIPVPKTAKARVSSIKED